MKDRKLGVAYAYFEFRRLGTLHSLIENLDEVLRPHDEFNQLMFLTFLYGYVGRDEGNIPAWQMAAQIKRFDFQVRQEMGEIQRLISGRQLIPEDVVAKIQDRSRTLRGGKEAAPEDDDWSARAYLERETLDYASAWRRTGQEMMTTWVRDLRPVNLTDILGEILRHLGGRERALEYTDLLTGWPGVRGAQDDHEEWSKAAVAQTLTYCSPEQQIRVLTGNARRLVDQREHALAERLFRRAVEILDTESLAADSLRPSVYEGLMACLQAQNKGEEALNCGRRIAEIYTARNEPDASWVAAHEKLATLLTALGREKEALAEWRLAISVARRESDFHVLELDILQKFSRALEAAGEREEARQIATEADELRLRGWQEKARNLLGAGEETESRAFDCNRLGVDLRNHGFPDLAEPLHRVAVQIDTRVLPASHPVIPHRKNNLATVLMMQGKMAEVRGLLLSAWADQASIGHSPVSARILMAMMISEMLEARPIEVLVRRLKSVLALPKWETPESLAAIWDFQPVLDFLKDRLGEEAYSLLTILLKAINDRENVARLEMLALWRSGPPIALDQPMGEFMAE